MGLLILFLSASVLTAVFATIMCCIDKSLKQQESAYYDEAEKYSRMKWETDGFTANPDIVKLEDAAREKYSKIRKRRVYGKFATAKDTSYIICGAMVVIVFLISLIISIIQICDNVGIKSKKMIYQREVLEYRIEHLGSRAVEESALYTEITDYNARIVQERVIANNPWLNLFAQKSIAELDTIDIYGILEGEDDD